MWEWKITIKGKVQGVGFRYSVIDFVFKNNLNITGYVRNKQERDFVEVVAHGQEQDLEKLLNFCHKGPTLSRIDHVAVEKMKINESFYKGFKISHSF